MSIHRHRSHQSPHFAHLLRSIKTTFRDLAVARAARHSTLLAGEGDEEADDSSSTADPSYTPKRNRSTSSTSSKPLLTVSTRTKNDRWRCFATEGIELGHQNAEGLKKLGVWLGAEDNPDEVVTEFSFNTLLEKYYELTNGGKTSLETAEPKTSADHAPNPPRNLACASCANQGRPREEGMTARHIQFHFKDLKRMVSRDYMSSARRTY